MHDNRTAFGTLPGNIAGQVVAATDTSYGFGTTAWHPQDNRRYCEEQERYPHRDGYPPFQSIFGYVRPHHKVGSHDFPSVKTVLEDGKSGYIVLEIGYCAAFNDYVMLIFCSGMSRTPYIDQRPPERNYPDSHIEHTQYCQNPFQSRVFSGFNKHESDHNCTWPAGVWGMTKKHPSIRRGVVCGRIPGGVAL